MKPGATVKTLQPLRGKAKSGAVVAQPGGWRLRLRNYFRAHKQAAAESFMRLVRAPIATLMTVSAIGVIVALPAALYVLLANGADYAQRWSPSPQITVFLKPDISDSARDDLLSRLRARDDVARVDHLTPDDALREYARMGGDIAAVDTLGENPFPHVLRVSPTTTLDGPPPIAVLTETLRLDGAVDKLHADVEWVARLYAVIEVAQRGLVLLAGLLCVAALLTISNTIRLAVENRRDEVAICQLIGASARFIRRPFVYTGIWFGLAGGAVAVLIVHGLYVAMQAPLDNLVAQLGDLSLRGLLWWETLVLLSSTTLLGWAGARFAAGRQLKRINLG